MSGKKGKTGRALLTALLCLFLTFILSSPAPAHYTEAKDYVKAPAIHRAAATGDFAEVKQLVRHDRRLVKSRLSNGLTPLHLAALFGHPEIIKFLIDNGADVNVKEDENYTPLHLAAVKNREKAVIVLISEGADVMALTKRKETPLHSACNEGSKDLIIYLIDHGADIYARDYDDALPVKNAYNRPEIIDIFLSRGMDENANVVLPDTKLIHLITFTDPEITARFLVDRGAFVNVKHTLQNSPLYWAVTHNKFEMSRMLVLAGADPNFLHTDFNGETPFQASAAFGNTPIFKLLAEHGGDYYFNANNYSLLHNAASSGNMEIIKLCLSKGLKPDTRDTQGRTPLHWAAFSGKLEAVRLFLSLGNDINTKDAGGDIPLHNASTTLPQSYETVKYLINSGSEIDTVNDQGETPLLSISPNNPKSEEIVKLLLAQGASPGKIDSTGKSVYHNAVRAENLPLLKYLLKKFPPKNPTKYTLLMEYACRSESTDVASYLIKCGADVNYKKGDKTLLLMAVSNGNEDITELLLDNGADINVKDSTGKTPLINCAFQTQYTSMIKHLLDRGDDINTRDNDGNTALHYTAKAGAEDATEMLLKRRANPNVKNNQEQTPLQLALDSGKERTARVLISNWADVDPAALSEMAKDKDRRMFNYIINHSMSLWLKVILPVFLLIIIIVTRILKRNKRPVHKV